MAKVKLSNVRLSFPDIFLAKEFQKGDGKPRFNATFLVVPGSDNDRAIRAAINEAAKEEWGAKWDKTLKSVEGQTNTFCYLDGNKKSYEGYEDMLYLAAHSKNRPSVFDRDKSVLTAEDGRPYAGCYVNASVEVYAQSGTHAGIRASFNGIQFYADGDAFSGAAPASPDDFDDLTEGADGGGLI